MSCMMCRKESAKYTQSDFTSGKSAPPPKKKIQAYSNTAGSILDHCNEVSQIKLFVFKYI